MDFLVVCNHALIFLRPKFRLRLCVLHFWLENRSILGLLTLERPVGTISTAWHIQAGKFTTFLLTRTCITRAWPAVNRKQPITGLLCASAFREEGHRSSTKHYSPSRHTQNRLHTPSPRVHGRLSPSLASYPASHNVATLYGRKLHKATKKFGGRSCEKQLNWG